MLLKRCGKAWKVGDDVPNDGGLLPLCFVSDQIFEPKILAQHCFEDLRPDLASQIRPGDFLVTGHNFAYGHPHVFGFLGLKALGIGGVLAESIGHGPYRLLVDVGIPFLSPCTGISERVQEGDCLEVDFGTGYIKNVTSGDILQCSPLPKLLQEIIMAGGGEKYTEQRLKSQSSSPQEHTS